MLPAPLDPLFIWYHPQNRKYTMYYNAARGKWDTAMGNMYRRSGEVQTCGSGDVITYRPKDTLITLPPLFYKKYWSISIIFGRENLQRVYSVHICSFRIL